MDSIRQKRYMPHMNDRVLQPAEKDVIESALRTIGIERQGLESLERALQNGLGQPFRQAVEVILGLSGRVIITGVGKSGHIGAKMAATFASTGTPSFFVHAAEAGHGDLGMIAGEDVVIALSWSGESAELRNVVHYARRFRLPLIAITCDTQSALGQAADIVLCLPRVDEACPHGLAPTTSTLMQLALGDALAVALLESRGFTALQFKEFHPGGKLGASLTFVHDLMHQGAAMPLVALGTRMSAALVEMTGK